ncbi:MAG: hypothetical protein ACR2I2_20765 [Bryobacteraceae bacterium]
MKSLPVFGRETKMPSQTEESFFAFRTWRDFITPFKMQKNPFFLITAIAFVDLGDDGWKDPVLARVRWPGGIVQEWRSIGPGRIATLNRRMRSESNTSLFKKP